MLRAAVMIFHIAIAALFGPLWFLLIMCEEYPTNA